MLLQNTFSLLTVDCSCCSLPAFHFSGEFLPKKKIFRYSKCSSFNLAHKGLSAFCISEDEGKVCTALQVSKAFYNAKGRNHS